MTYRDERVSADLFGRPTTIRLEPLIIKTLEEIKEREGLSGPALYKMIERSRQPHQAMPSAIRIWVLEYFRAKLAAQEIDLKPIELGDMDGPVGPYRIH